MPADSPSTVGGSPPNIVVVVLDCVRSSDFPGGTEAVRGMPFCEELRRESIVFPRAISTSPWTIPSHASLFTGLAPWETGCHWKGDLKLSPNIDRISSLLRDSGYRTMALSANPLIEPSFGLLDGFDQSAWAGWWEPFLRFQGRSPPHALPASGPNGHSARPGLKKRGPIDRAVKESRSLFVRHPFTLQGASRLVQRFRGEDGPVNRAMARWVEPTFDRWVRATPSSVPIFAFVNLLDAHEPYFLESERGEDLVPWSTYARTRQDTIAWLTGKAEPSAADLRLLHGLYREMIEGMDRRLRALVESLRAAGRWENTALILTADHGQAFGEHGMMFHMFRVDDQLVRIPLWVRLPGGSQGGSTARGWGSLVDVVPTALKLAGRGSFVTSGAYPLTDLLDAERPTPAVAISDGIIWEHFRQKFDPERARAVDRVWAAAYEGDRKVVVDAETGAARAYDLAKDPLESQDRWGDGTADWERLAESARSAGRQVRDAATAAISADVEDRLRAWGYI